MVCWVVIRADEPSGRLLESHAFGNDSKKAMDSMIGIEEQWTVPIKATIEWLLPGELPATHK
jgi:hypothetical protein